MPPELCASFAFRPSVAIQFHVHAGTHIDFSCSYENQSDATYVFGNSAHDNEMSILHGMYWPRMSPAYEQCLLGNSSRD